jgi:molybdopterin-guanine dinucleotide biosynthesis protein A
VLDTLSVSLRDCSAMVLAGGRSRRFGRDKADVLWRGRTLMAHVVARLRVLCQEVIAVSRREQEGTAWPVDRMVHDDSRAPEGPLRGTVSGLASCQTPYAFVLSCDTPCLKPELLVALRHGIGRDEHAAVPEWEGHLQPLVALYSLRALPRFRDHLESGERSPVRALVGLPYLRVSEQECERIDPDGWSFRNVNTPQDLEALELCSLEKELSEMTGNT